MASWKRLKSVTQSLSHHLQSGLSFIQPYITDELQRNEIFKIEIQLLPEIKTERYFKINDNLNYALNSAIVKFNAMLNIEGFNTKEIVKLKIIIEQQDYKTMDSAVTTIAENKEGRVISGFVQYMIDTNYKKRRPTTAST